MEENSVSIVVGGSGIVVESEPTSIIKGIGVLGPEVAVVTGTGCSMMNCWRLMVGTVKKFLAPTVVKTAEIGLFVLSGLQSLSMLTVKMSAENMKLVGLVLGVVTV